MTTAAYTLLGLIATPILSLITTVVVLWYKNRTSVASRENADLNRYVTDLRADGIKRDVQIADLYKKLDEKDIQIKTIQTELKNRDAEYLKLYQTYTTLKAQHEVLQSDFDDLKKSYDATSTELGQLKEDIKKKADDAAKAMQHI